MMYILMTTLQFKLTQINEEVHIQEPRKKVSVCTFSFHNITRQHTSYTYMISNIYYIIRCPKSDRGEIRVMLYSTHFAHKG